MSMEREQYDDIMHTLDDVRITIEERIRDLTDYLGNLVNLTESIYIEVCRLVEYVSKRGDRRV